jgi:hypothetical protein
MLKFVPTGILITLFPEIVPALVEILAPVVSAKLTCHVVPLHTPLPTVSLGNVQVVGQSELGVVTDAEVVQPAPLEAVIVTVVFFAIPDTDVLLIVPIFEETPLIASEMKSTLYDVPLQERFPTVKEGFEQEGHCLAGTFTTVLTEQPDLEAVIVTSVPLGILITLSPDTVPAEDVTVTVLSNFVKYAV